MIKTFLDLTSFERSVGKWCSFLSPNNWTSLSLILSVMSCFLIYKQYILFGLILFAIGASFDFIDGNVARYSNQASHLGAFWDGTVDRFVDAILIFSFFFLDFNKSSEHISYLLYIGLFVTLLPPFVVAYANHRQAVPDPTEKEIWRIAFRVEYLVLYIAAIAANPFNQTLSYWLLVAGIVLMAETVIQSIVMVFVKSKKYPQS